MVTPNPEPQPSPRYLEPVTSTRRGSLGVAVWQRLEDHQGGSSVGRAGDFSDLTSPDQSIDVRSMGMTGEPVAQKDHRFQLTTSGHRTDLQVSPQRSGTDQLPHRQLTLRRQPRTGGPGGDDLVVRESLLVLADQLLQLVLFLIVCDQSDPPTIGPEWIGYPRCDQLRESLVK